MSTSHSSLHGPVAIGGVGGSGTRVIAQMLIDLGFYLGKDLNVANDNLWFTLLMRRPRWVLKNADKSEIGEGLALFERAMVGRLDLNWADLGFILRATVDGMFQKNLFGPQLWLLRPALTLILAKPTDISKYRGWGWKEPNSHLLLGHLSEHFENLKFVHVIRHGLDIAFGRLRLQAQLWGESFGIEMPRSSKLWPKVMLNYWIKANERALTLGTKLLGERFLLLNFDDLCAVPRKGVERLVNFLGLDVNESEINRLASLVKTPKSKGRYKQRNIGLFSAKEINAVRWFGFEV